MAWFDRTGAVIPSVMAARRNPALKKADVSTRPLTQEELALDHELMMSTFGGSRSANRQGHDYNPDPRAQALAKVEAAEAHRASVMKADEARAKALGKPDFVLPSEEARRRAAAPAPVYKAPVAYDDGGDHADEPGDAEHATLESMFKSHLKRMNKILEDGLRPLTAGNNADGGDNIPPPLAVPVANLGNTRQPDRRTAPTTTHHVNRKMGLPHQRGQVRT